MAKDYSKLKNIKYIPKEDYINEKEIETKYSKFLDWLQDDIEKRELANTICDRSASIPIIFKDILFKNQSHRGNYYPYEDIRKYLNNLKIDIVYTFKDGYTNIYYTFTCDSYTYYIHQNIQKISSLEQTNLYILKKLEEQIQLNSKLCERIIFEMKHEKNCNLYLKEDDIKKQIELEIIQEKNRSEEEKRLEKIKEDMFRQEKNRLEEEKRLEKIKRETEKNRIEKERIYRLQKQQEYTSQNNNYYQQIEEDKDRLKHEKISNLINQAKITNNYAGFNSHGITYGDIREYFGTSAEPGIDQIINNIKNSM